MRLETALRIFGLKANPSTDELNKAFRRLAKRYHPDSNGDRVEWATDQMASINVAYETVRESIQGGDIETTRFRSEYTSEPHRGASQRTHRSGHTDSHNTTNRYSARSSHTHRRGTANDGFSATRNRSRNSGYRGNNRARHSAGIREEAAYNIGQAALAAFGEAQRRVFEGIHVYYQYGLENVHLRHEGPHRLKYRKATRLVMKGLDRFAELWTRYGPLPPEHPLTRFYRFADGFYRSMFLERFNNPYSGQMEQKAYGHYRYATQLLDQTIRDTCFPGLSATRVYDPSMQLEVCRQEYTNVFSYYSECTWSEESQLKLKLLDSFEHYLRSTQFR